MPTFQELKEVIIKKICSRKSTYSQVSVKSAIMKHEGIWKNIVTKIVPLGPSEVYSPQKKFDYGNFVLIENLISIDALVEIIEKLPVTGTTSITFGQYDVLFQIESLQNGYKFDSGREYLNIEWFFERYHFYGKNQHYSLEPIVAIDLPIFPDSRAAIEKYVGIDLSQSHMYGVIVCLPNYAARIEEINIGSKEMGIKVKPRAEELSNIVGKIYCRKNGEISQRDIVFKTETATVEVGFMPEHFSLAIISKVNGEIIDTRRFYSSWELPKGITLDIPEYQLIEIIKRGETETVEFKEDVGKTEEFAESAAAFANAKGGLMILGVDDHSNIKGLEHRDYEGIINNILRSRCEPQVDYKLEKRQVEEKEVLIIRILEGKDKPYTIRERGVYIRANATDRIATRFELDKFYENKHSRIIGY